MLKDDLYTIGEIKREGTSLKAAIHLDQAHILYQGHFPDQPVVPGACLLQIIIELAALATGKDWQLSKAATMKFLTLLDPRQTPVLQAELTMHHPDDDTLEVSATLLKETIPCFKFKGSFRPAAGTIDPLHSPA